MFLTVAELRRQLDLLDPPPDTEVFYEPPTTDIASVIVPVLGVAVVGHDPDHPMVYLVTSLAMNKPSLISARGEREEAP